jgi:hypothetical protein
VGSSILREPYFGYRTVVQILPSLAVVHFNINNQVPAPQKNQNTHKKTSVGSCYVHNVEVLCFKGLSTTRKSGLCTSLYAVICKCVTISHKNTKILVQNFSDCTIIETVGENLIYKRMTFQKKLKA